MIRGGRELSTFDAVGNPNYLRQCAYLSARRLGVDQIGLYYLHSPRARDASFEDQVGTLAELRKEGVIGHIGLSNVSSSQLRAALRITEIAAVTAYFNVSARQNAALLELALGAGAVFLPWQPVSLIQRASGLTRADRKRSGACSRQSPLATGRPSRRWRWLGCSPARPRSCRSRRPRVARICGRISMPRTWN